MQRSVLRCVSRRTLDTSTVSTRWALKSIRNFAADGSALPESLTRIGGAEVFPNEYPGQNYEFNWCLNGDGVTPLKKAAFRIMKPLDLRIAGLEVPKMGVKVKAAAAKKMPEAGSDALTFETFDEVSQRTKDLLSLSEKIFCPEGDFPGTRTGVRVITNSETLAPQLLAYLDRAPRRDPESQPITAYVLEGTEEEFSGYAIEEIEDETEDGSLVAKSVAAVVVVGIKPDIKIVAAGLELSQKGLEADEAERAAKRAAEANDESA
mmetsp:Transcript_11693/g.17159  ORF Transcript_11693/g.17159 Transcript_11693/m.17159 type:complete len:264 (+) Transcript_11693:81-872(+)|eukprot:CAMPEP_0194210520 /NCGR_PEP_ID=MMETSP0156-20130528/8655_1 /TAXON_ID=33649 /ORGANISM="Thalassionema nitzschioides, Strain L26-B" /LENGTH=263 /DNA_ID=CAMNT_0038937879 /DNA_START=41 /DNA_END=832 /DNA_ORIENTATION=+